MVTNKENKGLLGDLSIEQLREYWERADDTPGEQTMVKEFPGSVTKGQIARAIAGKTPQAGQIAKRSWYKRPSFHPIDGSRGMEGPGRRGAVIASSRR